MGPRGGGPKFVILRWADKTTLPSARLFLHHVTACAHFLTADPAISQSRAMMRTIGEIWVRSREAGICFVSPVTPEGPVDRLVHGAGTTRDC